MITGGIDIFYADKSSMAFHREDEHEKLACFFNISGDEKTFDYHGSFNKDTFISGGYEQSEGKVKLKPYSFLIAKT